MKACIACPRPAMTGRSRCSTCANYGPQPTRRHDARQTRFRTQVLADFTPGDPCWRCGKPIWNNVEAGHITPRSQGGSYHPSNGRPEHRSCNRADGARLGRGGKKIPIP